MSENNEPKNIAFVAGATGYTGQYVVEFLRQRRVTTIAHVRPDSSNLAQWHKKYDAMEVKVDTTPWKFDAMTKTFRELKPTIIFALLGTTKKRMKALQRAGEDPEAAGYDAVDYRLTAMLIQAAVAAEITPRFVYLSAIGVKQGTSNPYYQARVKAEEKLMSTGLSYVIARPSFITGPDREDRPMEKFGAKTVDGLLAIAGSLGATALRERYQSLTGRQLAEALVKVALDSKTKRQILETDELRRLLSKK